MRGPGLHKFFLWRTVGMDALPGSSLAVHLGRSYLTPLILTEGMTVGQCTEST